MEDAFETRLVACHVDILAAVIIDARSHCHAFETLDDCSQVFGMQTEDCQKWIPKSPCKKPYWMLCCNHEAKHVDLPMGIRISQFFS